MFDLEILLFDSSIDTEKTRMSANAILKKMDASRLDQFRAVIFKTKNCGIDHFKHNIHISSRIWLINF